MEKGIDRPRVTLPEGDYIDTAWIPDLLAQARWPDDSSPKMVTYFLVPDSGFNFLPVSDHDEALLREIWKGLPDPVLPMTEAAWQPYANAFNAAAVRPERGLRWNVDDPQFNARMKRASVKMDYQKILATAIEDGTLEVRSEGSLAVVPPPASGTRKLLATREVVNRFIESVGFEVVDKQKSKTVHSADLRPQAERSLLRIIRALLEIANLPNREEISTVAQMIESLGFVGTGDDAVRGWIDKARALNSDKPPK